MRPHLPLRLRRKKRRRRKPLKQISNLKQHQRKMPPRSQLLLETLRCRKKEIRRRPSNQPSEKKWTQPSDLGKIEMTRQHAYGI